jgi:hypothetical protein
MEPEPKGEAHELTEIEEWELEQRLLELAFMNSYVLLTGEVPFEDLMISNHKQGISSVLAHDPHEGPTNKDLDGIIKFFCEKEEYEMCHELSKVATVDGVGV